MDQAASTIDRARAFLVLAATVGTIAFNWLAAVGYVNGVTPGEVSDRYPTAITPAGYAFSIWSLIYIGLVAFSIYQLLPANLARFRHIRSLYIFSCALNCAWIFFFHGEQIVICFAIIFALLVVLVFINLRVRDTESNADSWLVKGTFGVYLGWVTAATLVNFAIVLVYLGNDLGRSRFLGAFLVLLAAAFGVVARLRLLNYLTPLAVAWALTAIAVKQSGQTLIVASAAAGVVVCLIAAFSVIFSLKSSTNE